MRANKTFSKMPKKFWANVRTIGETLGYTERGEGKIKVFTIDEIKEAMTKNELGYLHLVSESGKLTDLGENLLDYFEYRADILNNTVEKNLMNADEARELFQKVSNGHISEYSYAMNKQKGDKKKIAYLTAIVDILIEKNANGMSYDRDPRRLTTFTSTTEPIRTLSRRVDGCFPSVKNPIAVWEIKEYYYTTTFGSRVADGVYESLLDGMEIEELKLSENIEVEHIFVIDAHYTWWDCGKSYLCRIMDMLNMGYVDEVIFGREVEEAIPRLTQKWIKSLSN
jgi:hypothetical protein